MFGEPLGNGFGGGRPVSGFGSAKEKAKAEKRVKAAGQRREQRNKRIPGDSDGQAAFGADAIHEAAAEGLANGIGRAESDYDGGVVSVGPVIVTF